MKNYSEMKRIMILLFLLVMLQTGYSQETEVLSKAEKKELVKLAKKLKSNPIRLKRMLQETESLKETVSSLRGELNKIDKTILVYQTDTEDLKLENSRLEKELSEARKGASLKGLILPSNGIVFRVQIGGYAKRDLRPYVDNTTEEIQVERTESGIQEITVGQFSNYRKADELKKHLRAMGVKDAWIVPYKDGKRVLLKEVINEIEL